MGRVRMRNLSNEFEADLSVQRLPDERQFCWTRKIRGEGQVFSARNEYYFPQNLVRH